MAREIQHVRIREIPQWIAYAGVVVWCGATVAEVPGYRLLRVYSGPSRDGRGKIVLTFVQPRSQPAVADSLVSDLRDWAIAWVADGNTCL